MDTPEGPHIEDKGLTWKEADMSDPETRKQIEEFLDNEPFFLIGSPEMFREDITEAEADALRRHFKDT